MNNMKSVLATGGLFGTRQASTRLQKTSWRTARTCGGLFGGRPISTATRVRPAASFKPTRPTAPPAFRTDLAGDLLPFIIRGRAVPFEEFSCSELRENPIRIERGAFRNELRKIHLGLSNCTLKTDHRIGSWLASTSDGTLQVYESHDGPKSMVGLYFAARLPAVDWGREIALEIRGGKIGVSCALGLRETSDCMYGEVVKRSKLLEISLTKNPVFTQTWVKLEPLISDEDAIIKALYFGD